MKITFGHASAAAAGDGEPSTGRPQYTLAMNHDVAAAILNVDADADAETIRSAFKLRARMWHPDRFVGRTERERSEAATEFIRVTEAFELLSSRRSQQHEDTEAPATASTDVSPPDVGSVETRGSFSLREYLGFSTASFSLWEYLGFGSPRK